MCRALQMVGGNANLKKIQGDKKNYAERFIIPSYKISEQIFCRLIIKTIQGIS